MKNIDSVSGGLAHGLGICINSFLRERAAGLGAELSETKFYRKEKRLSVDKGETGKGNAVFQMRCNNQLSNLLHSS